MTTNLEAKLRRAARHHGLRLQKSRVRDVSHPLCGTYQLVDDSTGFLAYANWASGWGFGLDLIEVAEYLQG